MLLQFNFKRSNGLTALAAGMITGVLLVSSLSVAEADKPDADGPNLTGQVTDGEGEPLRDARVVIYSADVKEGTSPFCPTCYVDCGKRDVTDNSGRFRIENLDPSLLFRVLVVGKGYQPKFVEEVDPLGGALAITLDQPKPRSVKPTRQITGRVVDSEGGPIPNAIVEVTATHEDLPGDGSRHWGGAMDGLDPLAVTDQHGEFRLTSSKDFMSANVQVEAIRFAKRKVKLETGTKRHEVVLTKGAIVTGRVVNNGEGTAEVPLGLAAEERSLSELQFTGELTIGTQSDGRFAFVNVPPDRTYVLYGKIDGLGSRGAIPVRSIEVGSDGSKVDLGNIELKPGHRLAGRVTLADGARVPSGTRLMINRERAWDRLEVTLDEDGRFAVEGIPEERVSIDIDIPGYRLSTWNPNFDPEAYASELIGRVVGDIDPFTILMEKGEPYERDDDYYRHVPDKYHVEQLPLRGMASWEDPSKSFTISGKVIDARSGKPLDQFRVTPGRRYEGESEAYWWRHRETQFKDGEYTIRFQRGPGKPMIRVRADGYYAATTRKPLTTETKHHDFKVTPMGLPTKAVSSK